MISIACPTCGVGKVQMPDPVKDHVCDKYCGNLHFRHSHAMWKDNDGTWRGMEELWSISVRGEFYSLAFGLRKGAWPCMKEQYVRERFIFQDRKTGKAVRGDDIDLTLPS